jgi:hypothetical protein
MSTSTMSTMTAGRYLMPRPYVSSGEAAPPARCRAEIATWGGEFDDVDPPDEEKPARRGLRRASGRVARLTRTA